MHATEAPPLDRRRALAGLGAVLLLAPALVRAQAARDATPDAIRRGVLAQLPAPPDGFAWKLFRNATFLKPAVWKEREHNGHIAGVPTYGWSASAEDFSEAKPFETGASVQIVDGPHRYISVDARTMALAYLKPFMDGRKREDLLQFQQKRSGDFEYTVFRYRDAPKGARPLIVHKLLVANEKVDTLHIFSFQGPQVDWDGLWKNLGATFIGRATVLPHLPLN